MTFQFRNMTICATFTRQFVDCKLVAIITLAPRLRNLKNCELRNTFPRSEVLQLQRQAALTVAPMALLEMPVVEPVADAIPQQLLPERWH